MAIKKHTVTEKAELKLRIETDDRIEKQTVQAFIRKDGCLNLLRHCRERYQFAELWREQIQRPQLNNH